MSNNDNNLNKSREAAFDAILYVAFKENHTREMAALYESSEDSPPHTFSHRHTARMHKLFRRQHLSEFFKKTARQLNKVAIAILLVVTVLFGVLLTNEEVRATFRNVLSNIFGHIIIFDDDNLTVNRSESQGWIWVPELEEHVNVTMTTSRGLGSASVFNRMFTDVGVESGMALFEMMHRELHELFEGGELETRLERLEEGFGTAGYWFQNNLVYKLAWASEYYTRYAPWFGEELTPQQSRVNAITRLMATVATAHVGDMFRAAPEYFRETGSFEGFFDIAEINPAGRLSLHDVLLLSALGFDAALYDIIDTPGLSTDGREVLENFFTTNPL